jgi:hypothetical protein
MTPFVIQDCSLLIRMSGLLPAADLRELRDRIAACGENVLFHHFFETPLRPTFDNPDYRNDFAVWAKLYLDDRVLAERLGILDPYSCSSLDELRNMVLGLIDERLKELTLVPRARPGDEFFFQEATTVVFDTGERIRHPHELAPAIRGMTNGSIYYHFLEARRRSPAGKDDISSWLMGAGKKYERLIHALASIDLFFHSLAHLRADLLRALSNMESPG